MRLLLKLQSVFPKDINEVTYEAYGEALVGYKIDYIEKVAAAMVKEDEWFPLPKHFIDRLEMYSFDRTQVLEVNLLGEAPKKEAVVTEQLKKEK